MVGPPEITHVRTVVRSVLSRNFVDHEEFAATIVPAQRVVAGYDDISDVRGLRPSQPVIRDGCPQPVEVKLDAPAAPIPREDREARGDGPPPPLGRPWTFRLLHAACNKWWDRLARPVKGSKQGS